METQCLNFQIFFDLYKNKVFEIALLLYNVEGYKKCKKPFEIFSNFQQHYYPGYTIYFICFSFNTCSSYNIYLHTYYILVVPKFHTYISRLYIVIYLWNIILSCIFFVLIFLLLGKILQQLM